MYLGRYLPILAALDGVLYLKPDGYHAATHDVIRLHADVAKVKKQTGYVCCKPVTTGLFCPATPSKDMNFAIKASEILRVEPNQMVFQLSRIRNSTFFERLPKVRECRSSPFHEIENSALISCWPSQAALVDDPIDLIT